LRNVLSNDVRDAYSLHSLKQGWPDGYFSGHFLQMWLFLGAVFYKKNFGYILVWWLFCGYFSIFLKIIDSNVYLANLWLFLVFKSIFALY